MVVALKKKSSWRSLVSCFQDPETLSSSKKAKKNNGEGVIINKQNSFLGLSILDISNPSSTTLSEDLSISLAGSDLHVFTQAELKVITQSFSSNNFLGEGGFGPVHKGFIDDKLRPCLKAQPVAVKRLDLDGNQGHREWMDYTAKLSDFGLAKDGPQGDATHVSTRVMGTQGYAAPEYIMTGHLTARSDVYSFGVVLLELLTGRRSVDKMRSSREQSLVEWARPMLNDARKLGRIMDPRLEDQYSETGARKAASLAYQCLRYRPKTRPDISTVVSVLQEIKDYSDDIPIGVFTYTVPTVTRVVKETTSVQNCEKIRGVVKETNCDKTRGVVKETGLEKCDKASNNHRKLRSSAHTARNHQINLRNGFNSPMMRNEAGGERY